jgi:hypothetical protein
VVFRVEMSFVLFVCSYSSLVTPDSVYDYEFATKKMHLRKVKGATSSLLLLFEL